MKLIRDLIHYQAQKAKEWRKGKSFLEVFCNIVLFQYLLMDFHLVLNYPDWFSI